MYTVEMHMALILTILHLDNAKQGNAINPRPLETCSHISASVLLLLTQKTEVETHARSEVIATRYKFHDLFPASLLYFQR